MNEADEVIYISDDSRSNSPEPFSSNSENFGSSSITDIFSCMSTGTNSEVSFSKNENGGNTSPKIPRRPDWVLDWMDGSARTADEYLNSMRSTVDMSNDDPATTKDVACGSNPTIIDLCHDYSQVETPGSETTSAVVLCSESKIYSPSCFNLTKEMREATTTTTPVPENRKRKISLSCSSKNSSTCSGSSTSTGSSSEKSVKDDDEKREVCLQLWPNKRSRLAFKDFENQIDTLLDNKEPINYHFKLGTLEALSNMVGISLENSKEVLDGIARYLKPKAPISLSIYSKDVPFSSDEEEVDENAEEHVEDGKSTEDGKNTEGGEDNRASDENKKEKCVEVHIEGGTDDHKTEHTVLDKDEDGEEPYTQQEFQNFYWNYTSYVYGPAEDQQE